MFECSKMTHEAFQNFSTGSILKQKKKPKFYGAFQNFMQMLSHDKIIFHMLFGAFHVTPRNITYILMALKALIMSTACFGYEVTN